MRVATFLFSIGIFIIGIACLAGLSGCASIVPPSGGTRDTIPPVIVGVDPLNETTNFNSKTIRINFNEYVELDDVYRNMVISPLPKIMPEVTRKLRTVTVKIKDSLEPNTTYVYNFARVIKDLNEGNRGKDLLYVVSTGTYFDSLQLSGNVRMAKTGKPDSTLTVMLYSNLSDSAVAKERPRYITRVDSTGTFFFRYLAPGTYRLYALKDESGSYLYNGEQVFAFADSTIVLSTQPPEPIRMYAYAPEEKPEDQTESKELLNKKEKRLRYQTNLEGDKQDLLQAFTLKFRSPLKNFDTTKMSLTADSSFRPVTGQRFSIDSTRTLITMNMPWTEDALYNLVLEKDFASDSLDRQLLKKDTVRFKTKSRQDYGQAKITFVDIDLSRSPVLLISQGETVKNAFPIPPNRIIELQLYNPGEYDMQILYDKNRNNKWDPGAYFTEHRQPELIESIDRKLILKPISQGMALDFEIRMAPAGRR